MDFLKRIFFTIAFIPCILFLILRLDAFFYQLCNIEEFEWINKGLVLFLLFIGFLFQNTILSYLNSFLHSNKRVTVLLFFLGILMGIFLKEILVDIPAASLDNGDSFLYAAVLGSGIFFALFLEAVVSIFLNFYHSLTDKTVLFTKKELLFFSILFLLFNIGSVLYLVNSRTVFFWDTAGYWKNAYFLSDLFTQDFFAFVQKVYFSVLESDYNYIIDIPMALLCTLFGKSRMVFILGIVNLYFLPIAILIFAFAKTQTNKPILITFCLLFTFPYLIFAALTGFIDIGGIFCTLSAFFLYQKNKSRQFDTGFFTIGLLLAFSVVLRRWYAFYAVSFVTAVTIDCIFFKKSFRPLREILFSSGFFLLFFFQDLVTKKLMVSYTDAYSAYSLGIQTDYFLFVRYFGIVILGIFLFYSVRLFRLFAYGESAVFCMVQFFVCFLLFVRVQTHGQQHLALYVPSLLYIFFLFYSKIIAQYSKNFVIPVLLLFSFLPTANTFVLRQQPVLIKDISKNALLPNFSLYPPRRQDIEELLCLVQWLDLEIGKKDKTVSILSSSFVLNKDILTNVESSLSQKPVYSIKRNYILDIPNVDKRDGFPYTLFACDYVVVPSPLQTHLPSGTQMVIELPCQYFYEGIGFAAAFEKLSVTFQLNDGVTVSIYKKVRPITAEEKKQLHNAFYHLYPDLPQLFPKK